MLPMSDVFAAAIRTADSIHTTHGGARGRDAVRLAERHGRLAPREHAELVP